MEDHADVVKALFQRYPTRMKSQLLQRACYFGSPSCLKVLLDMLPQDLITGQFSHTDILHTALVPAAEKSNEIIHILLESSIISLHKFMTSSISLV